jgi:hypothetical protein
MTEPGTDVDQAGVMEELSQALTLQSSYESWRSTIRTLVEKALLAGINPHDLYDRPYSSAHIREIYNRLRSEGADLPELKRGAPKRRPRT